MSPIVTYLATLLVGIFLGAAGKYFADKFTDQRRNQEERDETKSRFAKVRALMPELIAEMREDLLADTSGTRREFFPYNIGVIFNPGPDKFFYEPAKHPDLTSKLVVLENQGYIINVAVSSTAKFRMTEDFVALLKKNN